MYSCINEVGSRFPGNGQIENMAILTASVNIFPSIFFHNTKVAGLGKMSSFLILSDYCCPCACDL